MTAPLNRPLKPRVTPVGRGRAAPRIVTAGAALAVGLASPSIPDLLPNQFRHEQQAFALPPPNPLRLRQQAPDPFHPFPPEEFRPPRLKSSKEFDPGPIANRDSKIKFLPMPRDQR